ncbi:peptidase M14 [Bizionia saleffrena]|uniref:Peptidase M14 n=1 Tax=Bizionia saleffrena TaxID=291189 RepID=A0A8H2QF19_9FLAO|nr:M14 metallopeptidase family protein [Bizionia saleffrena]TYB76750.1 peptidase M14 [Bizionia saleffrena]
MEIEALQSLFLKHKERSLFGRYIHSNHIEPLLTKLPKEFKVTVIGVSVNDHNIYSITIGTGHKKILMWSQMHGNEATTTKALFDLINTLKGNSEMSETILKHFTLTIIPILNPDGAKAYTRLNANSIDLNRDAQNLSQPESRALRACFDAFKPHYCFNLHGQRTIFSAGHDNKVATLSFLSPAQDEQRSVTQTRAVAMSVINRMTETLYKEIPGQVGIYDDSFNIDCVGDTFQALNVPTVLFEAGHYKEDYDREEVRRLVFQSYLVALSAIRLNTLSEKDVEMYLKTPQNEKLFFDIIIKNAIIGGVIRSVAIQYDEQLLSDSIVFIPKIVKIDKGLSNYGHREINANGKPLISINTGELQVGMTVNSVLLNNEVLSLKLGNN